MKILKRKKGGDKMIGIWVTAEEHKKLKKIAFSVYGEKSVGNIVRRFGIIPLLYPEAKEGFKK